MASATWDLKMRAQMSNCTSGRNTGKFFWGEWRQEEAYPEQVLSVGIFKDKFPFYLEENVLVRRKCAKFGQPRAAILKMVQYFSFVFM